MIEEHDLKGVIVGYFVPAYTVDKDEDGQGTREDLS